MTTPTLTPAEALARLEDTEAFTHDGWRYVLDSGPMGTPREFWYPVAAKHDDPAIDPLYFPTGELGDKITETDTWVLA